MLCAWLLVTPVARAAVVVNWLAEPLVLYHGDYASVQTPVDISGNGIYDFIFAATINFIGVKSIDQNRYIIEPSPPPNIGGPVEPLYPDYEIGAILDENHEWFGASHDFYSGLGIWLSTGSTGNFRGHHAYMGIEFYIDDMIHYGWVNLWVAEGGPYGEIYGWAYESTAGMPITAGAVPEPTTIALIGLGSIALLFRKKSIANKARHRTAHKARCR